MYSSSTRTFLNNYDVGKKMKALLEQSSQYQYESKRIKNNIVETTVRMMFDIRFEVEYFNLT